METFLAILAVLGLVLMVVGRLILLNQAREYGIRWLLALLVVPMAEFVFLMRYWDSAKTGALTSLVGIMLVLPFGAYRFLESQQQRDEYFAVQNEPDANHQVTQGRYRRITFAEAKRREQRNWIMQKEIKVQDLNARLLLWYQSLQQKRIGLDKHPPNEIQAFNQEAAAYQALLLATKEEATELESLKNDEGIKD